MSALRRQLAHPRGLGGWIAGQLMLRAPARRARARWVVSLLDIQPYEHVLDVGFGPGYSTGLIAARLGEGGAVVGVDHSALMTSMAMRRLAPYARAGRVTLLCADVLDLPRFDVSFDKVASIDAYEFHDDPAAVLRLLLTRMTPGGRIALTVQPRRHGVEADTAQKAGSRLVRSLESAGFVQCETHFNASLGSAPGVCVLARSPARGA